MDVDEAIDSGARALFGEKYGDAGPRRLDGLCGETADGAPPIAPSRSSFAAAPMSAAPATSASFRSWRNRRRGRRAPHRGEDRRGGAPSSQAAGATAAWSRAAAASAPEDEAAERLSPIARGAPQARTRIDRCAQEARDGRRRGASSRSRTSAAIKFFARTVSGIEMKDLKSLADEAKQSRRLRRRRHRRRRRGRQGRRRRRRDRRSDARFDAVDSRARRFGETRRQGRRRPPRYGAGRRPGRRRGRPGARGHRRNAGEPRVVLTASASPAAAGAYSRKVDRLFGQEYASEQ